MKWWQKLILESWRTGAAALLILFAMFFVDNTELRIELISIACIFGFAAAADAMGRKDQNKKDPEK